LSATTKGHVPSHIHAKTEILDVDAQAPDKPIYRPVPSSEVILLSMLLDNDARIVTLYDLQHPDYPDYLRGDKIIESKGSTFPENPKDGQTHILEGTGILFRYSERYGMWIPTGHPPYKHVLKENIVYNSDFEIDSDGDGIPDGWTVGYKGNPTYGLDSTYQKRGKWSFKMDCAGGEILQLESYYIPIKESANYFISSMIKANAETSLNVNVISVLWYDKDKNYISLSSITSKNFTADWNKYSGIVTSPDNAVYAKIRILHNRVGLSEGAILWVDDLQFYEQKSDVEYIADNLGIESSNQPLTDSVTRTVSCSATKAEGSKYCPETGWADLGAEFDFVQKSDVRYKLRKVTVEASVSWSGYTISATAKLRCMYSTDGGNTWNQFGSEWSKSVESDWETVTFTGDILTGYNQSLKIKLQYQLYVVTDPTQGTGYVYLDTRKFRLDEFYFQSKRKDVA